MQDTYVFLYHHTIHMFDPLINICNVESIIYNMCIYSVSIEFSNFCNVVAFSRISNLICNVFRKSKALV